MKFGRVWLVAGALAVGAPAFAYEDSLNWVPQRRAESNDPSRDGGWESSGGELFKDARNPWFIKPSAPIPYCIRFDAESMSVDESTARAALEKAFDYWKGELYKGEGWDQPGFVRIGPIEFREVKCEEGPRIRFLFGRRFLSEEEIKFLKKPEKYIGVTVRTQYDRVHLQETKGFVYISGDRGEGAYENTSGALVSEAWSKPQLLQYALLHEVGHIIGLPHSGEGLMSEVFLNQILNKGLANVFSRAPIEPFFGLPGTLNFCKEMNDRTRNFFGAAPSAPCLQLQIEYGLEDVKSVQVFASDADGKVLEKLGDFRVIAHSLAGMEIRPAIIVHLPDEQVRFSKVETGGRNFLFGPFFRNLGATASFMPIKAGVTPKSIYFTWNATSLKVTGMAGGKQEVLLAYYSPITLLLMMPPILGR